MKAKKVLSLLLAGVMTLSLTACGGASESASHTTGNTDAGRTDAASKDSSNRW